jgi:hypothetical protein
MSSNGQVGTSGVVAIHPLGVSLGLHLMAASHSINLFYQWFNDLLMKQACNDIQLTAQEQIGKTL